HPGALLPHQARVPRPRNVRLGLNAGVRVSFDEAFDDVMRACGNRSGEGTWITPDILSTYSELHRLGWAHSVEAWQGRTLAGGLYGIALGGLFAGESMFHRVSGASKVAFAACAERLRDRGFRICDWPGLAPHRCLLGCREIPRAEYRARVREALPQPA